MARECRFCGGDASEPDHRYFCDGQQGAVEVAEPPRVSQRRVTTPRDTSVQAFYNAVSSGKIRTRQQQAYFGVEALGIATSGETFEYLKEQKRFQLRYDSNTCARFTELRDLGLIREVGRKVCRITGETCIAWSVVPPEEYAGPATVHRCPFCNQIVSRDVPVLSEVG